MILFPISNLVVTLTNTFLVIKIVLRFSDILFLYMKVACNDGVSHRGAISFGMVHIPVGNEGARLGNASSLLHRKIYRENRIWRSLVAGVQRYPGRSSAGRSCGGIVCQIN